MHLDRNKTENTTIIQKQQQSATEVHFVSAKNIFIFDTNPHT